MRRRRRPRLAFGGPALPRRGLRRPLRLLVLLVLATLLIARLFVIEVVVVRGDTMAPNVLDGDILLVVQHAEPALGDVVLVEVGGRTVLRRVLGLPGDRLAIEEGAITRNGLAMEITPLPPVGFMDPETHHPREQQAHIERFSDGRGHIVLDDHTGSARPWTLTVPEVEVPPGHLYVLCDNRRACPLDERAGLIARGALDGVIERLLWYGDGRLESPGPQPLYGMGVPVASSTGSFSTDSPRK
ncbi:MAG: signal peptidase I [Myxococcales bacterium]|nr:signal peptidase I [Myxococcales bacterium]